MLSSGKHTDVNNECGGVYKVKTVDVGNTKCNNNTSNIVEFRFMKTNKKRQKYDLSYRHSDKAHPYIIESWVTRTTR